MCCSRADEYVRRAGALPVEHVLILGEAPGRDQAPWVSRPSCLVLGFFRIEDPREVRIPQAIRAAPGGC